LIPSAGATWENSEPATTEIDTIQGTQDVFVWTRDQAGNIADLSGSANIVFDSIFPTVDITISPKTGDANDTVVQGDVIITLNFGEELLSTPSLSIVDASLTINAIPTISQYSNTIWLATLNVSASVPEGIASFSIIYTDLAGNISTQVSSGTSTFNVDTGISDPTIEVEDRNSGSGSYTNERIVSINIGSPAETTDWYVTDNNTTSPSVGAAGWQNTKPITTNIEDLGDGTKNIYLWIKNDADYISSEISDSIYLDTSDPTAAIIMSPVSIGLGTANITFNISEELNNAPTLWFVNSGNTIIINLAKVTSLNWEGSFEVTAGYKLGIATFNAVIADNALNVSTDISSGVVTFDIQLTMNNPSFNMVDRTTSSNIYSNDRTVSINIWNDAGAAWWIVSENQTTQPDGAGPWTGYPSPSTINLSSTDGVKTVYVWIKDAAGNMNPDIVSISINLDMTSPSAVVDMSQYDIVPSMSVDVTFNFNEGMTVTPTIRVVGTATSIDLTLSRVSDSVYTSSFDVNNSLGEGAAYYTLVATDNAENIGVALSGENNFTVKTLIAEPTFFMSDQAETLLAYTILIPKIRSVY